jgi:hypothetical protein
MEGHEAGIGDEKNTHRIFLGKAKLFDYRPGQDLRASRGSGSLNSQTNGT